MSEAVVTEEGAPDPPRARVLSGLASSGARALEPRERKALAALARRAAIRASAAVLVVIAAIVIAVIAPALLSGIALSLAITVVVFGGPAALLAAAVAIPLARALQRDVARGAVEMFRGALIADGIDDPIVKRAIAGEPSIAERGVERLFESGLLWDTEAPGAMSSGAAYVAELSTPAPVPTGADGVPARERPLTDDERAEIRALARRVSRLPLTAWAALAGCGLLALLIASGHEPTGWGAAVQVPLTIVVAVLVARAARGRRQRAKKLLTDAAGGKVRLTTVSKGTLEWLPTSSAPWNRGSSPAPWRWQWRP
jgi:hypothetical protein